MAEGLDLIERLRYEAAHGDDFAPGWPNRVKLMNTAAQEITRLHSQLAIKDKALRETQTMVKLLTHGHDRQALISEDQKALIIEVLDRASLALTTGGTDGAV